MLQGLPWKDSTQFVGDVPGDFRELPVYPGNGPRRFLSTGSTRGISMEETDDDEAEPAYSLDLPILMSKPSYLELVSILKKLTPAPPSWSTARRPPRIIAHHLQWLTRLIATPMSWLTPSEHETIISMASNNLALRAGRTAAPDMKRRFTVGSHEIVLFEPSWTGDSLGHKTWGASLVLATRLSELHALSNSSYLSPSFGGKCLGLGEGTGLLGIAAVKVMTWNVTLTDLPSITANLRRNVEYNCSERAEVRDLDWMDPPDDIEKSSFDVVIGSDLIYDAEHPRLVVAMLERYLKRDRDARVVLAYPLRTSHAMEIAEFDECIAEAFEIESVREETGMDDWDTEVYCRWTIYRWKQGKIVYKKNE